MSLLRLLAAGRTLNGATNGGGRYRETRQRLLPKFGATGASDYGTTGPQVNQVRGPKREGRNPNAVAGLGTADAASRESASCATVEQSGGRSCSGAAMTANAEGSSKSDGMAQEVAATGRARAASERATELLMGGFVAVGKAWGWLLRPSNKRSRPALRASRPAVQGELSLDRVKVVRNDLSQEELEVVPVKKLPVVAGLAPEAGQSTGGGAESGRSPDRGRTHHPNPLAVEGRGNSRCDTSVGKEPAVRVGGQSVS
jgi:hypothetical protein